MKAKNRFFSSIPFLARFVLLFFLLTLGSSLPLMAEETIQVTDAVNSYVYNPEQPDTISPLYIGDAITPNGILYLPDTTSQLTISQDGEAVELEGPGFYDASGSVADVSDETREHIISLVGAHPENRHQAEKLTKDTFDQSQLLIDDPVVASPST